MQIVKVQRALFPPDGESLVYDKDKKHVQTIELPAAVRHKMGHDVKAFFEATWTGTWLIYERTSDQSW